jgi:hypothetical protein
VREKNEKGEKRDKGQAHGVTASKRTAMS